MSVKIKPIETRRGVWRQIVVGVVAAALLVAALTAEDARAHMLSFTTAKRVALVRANGYAHQPTKILRMLRQGSHAYYVQADWSTPKDLGGGVVINEYHAIALRVTCIGPHSRLNARRVCPARAFVTDVFG